MTTPAPPRRRWFGFKLKPRTAAAVVVILCGLAYVGVPKVVWLWRSMQQINVATEIAATTIGKAPVNWRTTDIDGAPQSLVDYRGKVVVLDFWFAGCGWCQRTMPQINSLVDEFQGQPVAIVGVNSDDDQKDTRRVIDTFHLTYPTLKNDHQGTRLDKAYHVTMWPTMIVLDQRGVVRHVHCGYWPSLKRTLGSKIRELLTEDQAVSLSGQ